MELTELIDVEFGKKVRNKRKAIHLSQENLAYSGKIDRTHMGHIERGNVSPSLKKMNQIALALGITLNDLLEDIHLTNPA